MAHLSSTSLFLLVPLATVLVLAIPGKGDPMIQKCNSGDLCFSDVASLEDFFEQPYGKNIGEGDEDVKVMYDQTENMLTVDHDIVPQPWFVVTKSPTEKALIIPTAKADYVLLRKAVGTAANAGQPAATKTEITLERGDFPEGDVMDERADQIARFLISLDSPVPAVEDAFTDYMRSRRGHIE
eukprot:GHVS01107021.1.p2 GENE.GHVS01107021.1~~GHVS01107021.1.p2  ORF type:complete len:183 (+),score=29.71 GHVS01107021.1:182-730(+)